MAWNQPNDISTKSKDTPRRKYSGLVAGTLVVLGGVATLCYFYFFSHAPQSKSAPVKLKKAPAVASVRSTIPAKPIAEEVKTEIPYWKVDASQTNGFTKEMLHKWRDVRRPVRKATPIERRKAKTSIFDHKSENLIAHLLRMEPGKGLIGTPNYRGIQEDFLKSCQEPIVVKKDDDDFVKQLKKDLIEAKIELKQRIDAGEQLEDIIEDTRAEYRKLAQYKQLLSKQLREMVSKPGCTAQDIDNFEAAANKMLEAKGIAPMKLSKIVKARLMQLNQEGESK